MGKMKKATIQLGDIFTFPLDNGLNCFGQVVCFNNEHEDLLLVLFDFVSKDMPDLPSISCQPILGIANMDDTRIAQGVWKVVGNTDVAVTNVILPNYMCGYSSISERPIIKSYLGEFVRFATKREFDNALNDSEGVKLRFWTSHDSYCFVELANSVFYESSQDLIEFKDRLFQGSMWDISSNQEGIPLETYLKNKQISIPHKVDLPAFEVTIKLQFKHTSNQRQLEIRNHIEDVVAVCLQKTQNGEVVGSEISVGEAFIFCLVHKPKLAVSSIEEVLKSNGLRNMVLEITWSRV